MPKLILASTSKSRYNLLRKLKISFETVASNVDETPHQGESPEALVERLSIAKASAVAAKYPEALIIGADQVADFNGQILGKPGNFVNAHAQLAKLSGNTVTFYTGMCLLNAASGHRQIVVEPYTVTFRQLTLEMITHYLKREQPYECAGSFQIEGLGIALFQRLEGDDPNTLIGLPLMRLVRMLENEGFPIL